MDPLVLASGSPRRRDLLERAGVALEVVPADVDETRGPDEDPVGYARRLAAAKASAGSRLRPGRAVLGADTIVVVDDGASAVLGKPANAGEARAMMARLQGRAHRVVTAYHLLGGQGERSRAVETEVHFRAFSPAELDGYVASREWQGKAGGYAVQGLAAAFVRAVHGSYTNVVGLPLCEVLEDLSALGLLPADWTLRARAE
jgi:septum formation protein